VGEQVEGRWCARNLQDGTLVCATGEPDEEMVTVFWQGDPNRSSTVPGIVIASVAVARYVELRYLAEGNKETRKEFERMAQHFTVKTGEGLVFEEPDNAPLEIVGRAMGKLGQEAVLELLKKAAGL
jgi:hypothetical protein